MSINQKNEAHPLAGENILVTGATGFTGSVLTKKLVKIGANVTAIARSSSDLKQFNGLKINWIKGNVYDHSIIDAALKNITYVFHVVAAFREAKISDKIYHDVHVKSTQLLAKKAHSITNFKRFIHISTIGVHSHIEDPPADENYRFKPGDIYQETKAEAELWIRDYAKKENFPISVVRPSAIYGPGDKRLLKVFKMASKPIFPIIGYGKCLYHLIHVEDLTDFFILVATHPKALGEVFICGNESSIQLTEMVNIISSVYGKKVKFFRIPAAPMFVLGYLCEKLFSPFGIEPPIYRRRVAFYTKDRCFNTSKIRQVLNYKTKYDNKNGLTETAKWYLENNWVS